MILIKMSIKIELIAGFYQIHLEEDLLLLKIAPHLPNTPINECKAQGLRERIPDFVYQPLPAAMWFSSLTHKLNMHSHPDDDK